MSRPEALALVWGQEREERKMCGAAKLGNYSNRTLRVGSGQCSKDLEPSDMGPNIAKRLCASKNTLKRQA